MKSLTAWACVLVFVVSCADTKTTISSWTKYGPVGTVETHQFIWGEQNFSNSLFGIIQSGNLDIGFGKFADLFTALVGAYYVADVAKAQEITKQLSAKGATDVQVAQINASAQEVAQKAKINGGITKDAINAGLFKPAATDFKQP